MLYIQSILLKKMYMNLVVCCLDWHCTLLLSLLITIKMTSIYIGYNASCEFTQITGNCINMSVSFSSSSKSGLPVCTSCTMYHPEREYTVY